VRSVRTVPLDTSPVDLLTARAIEAAEARAWADMYAAAPPDFAQAAGLGFSEMGGALVLRWAATGRRYFSRAVGLGVLEPVTEATLDRIIDHYGESGITMFLLQSLPHCEPDLYPEWLGERGLEPFDGQDRVVRGGESLVRPGHGELAVEPVNRNAEDEWADFIQCVYRLDTGTWLQQLVGRPGWHHYVVRDQGEIVAARSMHIGSNGTAWMGIDGPVPGLITDDYEPDAALCAFMVEDGLERGAHGFIADIEAPSEDMSTPAYEYFGRLGFRRPYVRTHYARL
jgi:hypothetical protein